jgi:hypothetical protein
MAKKGKTTKKKKTGAPTNILAIAIGDPAKSRKIISMTQINGGVRPYILGLVTYLIKQNKYSLGTDYTIDYRECALGDVDKNLTGNPAIIFCMSTPVARRAKHFTAKIPTVVIVSDYHGEGFDTTTNICGVDAQRFQIARKYYDHFQGMVPKVYVLCKPGNTASDESWKRINQPPFPKPVVPLNVNGDTDGDIDNALNRATLPGGLLVLPVDQFFGSLDHIHLWAKQNGFPVFEPVGDWVPPAVGGYGAGQEVCGEAMGIQVQYILDHPGKIPTGAQRWITLGSSSRTLVASKAVAAEFKIELGTQRGMRLV